MPEWRRAALWIDIQLDTGANALSSFDDARASSVRRACERYEMHLADCRQGAGL